LKDPNWRDKIPKSEQEPWSGIDINPDTGYEMDEWDYTNRAAREKKK